VDRRYASNSVMRRILSLARKHGYTSLLIDEIDEAAGPLFQEENAALRLRRPDFVGSIVHRLAMFRCLPDAAPTAADFVGYVVVKRDRFGTPAQERSHVFECVMPPVRRAEQNNFIHCSRDYRVQTTAGTFQVNGVLYAQQNDQTFVCAHVGLRSALACLLPDADITYGRMNSLVGVDHRSRTVGAGGGLSPADIERVLQGVGVPFQKLVHEPNQNLLLPSEFQRDLYGFIESGMPALLGFELDQPAGPVSGAPRHLIPVFGHTLNEDTWLPEAQRAYFNGGLSYYPSENWLSTFVVHDDNFGPYYCLPRFFLRKDNLRVLFGLKRDVTPLSAVEAEAVGFDFLKGISTLRPRLGIDWYDRFAVFARAGWLVLRTLLLSRADYLGHLRSLHTWTGGSLEQSLVDRLAPILPDSLWMIEASAPELFASSRRKFGEVILDARAPLPTPLTAASLKAARLPGIVLFQHGGAIVTERTALNGHTQLFVRSAS
ncbi:MAG: hypothetical protein Q7T30_03110, partial [Planctomycetota bacterium]|nr:hypothetical protein [Planctomycetota bacterium]